MILPLKAYETVRSKQLAEIRTMAVQFVFCISVHCYEHKSGLTCVIFAFSTVGFAFSQEEDARVGQVSYHLFLLLVNFLYLC